jgi:hypothetical protein
LGNTGGTNGLLDGLDDRLARRNPQRRVVDGSQIGTNAAGTATPMPGTAQLTPLVSPEV